jgi:hypothetical protein
MQISSTSSQSFTCISCGTSEVEPHGWAGLCNRNCFCDLRGLLDEWNKALPCTIPDDRLIKYFTNHPDSGHNFDDAKILEYLENAERAR